MTNSNLKVGGKGAPKTARQCSRAHLLSVERSFRDGSVVRRAEAYVKRCRGKKDGKGCFPNLAGLCRVLGVGLGEMRRLGDKYPLIYDALLAVLEDGALNAECVPGKSAQLAMTYFRRRLGYEAVREERGEGDEGGDRGLRVVFEHDIMEDGK